MAFVPEGRCDRSLARSAWGSATQKSRPVGYGLIRAGVRTGTRSYRTLRDDSPGGRFSQALRARLLSCCPSGTKYIFATGPLIKLALMGLKPRAEYVGPLLRGKSSFNSLSSRTPEDRF